MTASPSLRPLAVYVHWPFCLSKCPYCDFNSHVREKIDASFWEKSLLKELKFMASLTPHHEVQSLFFGGGTPSLMPPSTVEAIITHTQAYWPCSPTLEITLEANPGSVDQARFSDFRQAGVNRVSVGIQSFNNTSLQFLGRGHTAEEGKKALHVARTLFPRYSFDLIYALPHQTPAQWEKELGEALQEAGTHLSLYQLTLEEGTGFYRAEKQGKFQMPSEDEAGELYEMTQYLMEDAGFPAYEISNHAVPGFECRHNLAYWRYEETVGIGPGAHGRWGEKDQRYATRCIRTPEAWAEAVQKQGHGLSEKTLLPQEDQGLEALMMGMRLKEGIKSDFFETLIGKPLLSFLDKKALDFYTQKGCLLWDGHRLKATPYGQQRLNSLLSSLLLS